MQYNELFANFHIINEKKVGCLVNDVIQDDQDCTHIHWYLAILDMIKTKIYKPPIEKPKKKPPTNILKVFFHNKAIEMINLPHVLHSSNLEKSFPKEAGPYLVPTVVHKLGTTIQSSIFNYSKFVETVDLDSFLNNENSLPCNCENSPFADSHHGHIVTGDLRLVTNAKLRKLLVKGPKYREPVTINFVKAKDEIVEGVNSIIIQWSVKYGVDRRLFDQWKADVLELVNKQINDLQKNIKYNKITPSLKQKQVKEALDDIHNQYVITPVDKASGNVAIICKRFYAQVLVEELGLKNKSDNTYEQITSQEQADIIKKHQTALSDLFNLQIGEDMIKLPKMYWIPKIHKTPIKSRFIVASVKCTTKPLAKAVTTVLKFFLRTNRELQSKKLFLYKYKNLLVHSKQRPGYKKYK